MAKMEDGTYTVEIAGEELALRLSHTSIMRLEAEIDGNINKFIMKASTGDFGIDDIVKIFFWGAKHNHNLKATEIQELIFKHGMYESFAIAVEFIGWSMNGGKDVIPEDEDDTSEKK